ncbi:PREDICTED: uncharacterized protein LOC109185885 isoform X2 [Ipomoea nil]|uniref:uncharacterized protein LOC109185885 isoform X2 n=1 Tax=Ipomoea nil TaxID=35883 RepID=UPI00090104E7|nr:PREDICTED: uncharacterized protein LOC109185885 isoform X2 [Ipomoea nil]
MSSGNNEELDLRLALGYSDQNNASRVNNGESGAGVNAGTGGIVGMTFAASDPLSELVWSPHKGLSLKCTATALADKKPLLLWNMGPSNVTHNSPSQTNIFDDEGNKDVGKGKLLVTEAMSLLDMEDAQRIIHLGKSSSRNVVAPTRPSCGNEMGNSSGRERLNTGDTNKIAENLSKKRKKDASPPQHIQITQNDKYNAGPGEERAQKSLQQVAEDNASGNQILGLGLTLSSEIHSSRKLGSQVALNLIPQQESNEKAASLEQESGGKREEHLEKQESSAENDKQKLVTKEGSEQNEKRVTRENSVPLETSLALRRRKGKEKVFSDGNGNGNSRMSSNEEEDSHESVDSCNSTRMFPQGKRQLQLEQQPLVVGGKRIKTELQGHTASTSNVGNDSSFMTWISNMVNGFSKTNREEAPLPLPLAHSLPGNERNRGEIITYCKDVERNNTGFQTMFHSLLCPPEPRTLKDDSSTRESKEVILPGNDEIVAYDKNHNSGSENTGFQSMFRSLFRPPSVMPEKRMLKDDPPTRESKEVILADKMIIEASPISCHRESSGSDEQIFVSSDKVITSALAHRDGISTKFPIKSFNVGPTWDACKSTSTEKKSSGNSSSRKTTEGGKSSGSLRKLKTRNGNNNSSSHPSEAQNLWITRFCVKDHPGAMNLDEFKENRDETTQCSPDHTRSNPNAQVSSEFPIDQKGQLKSSEAMASLFARRLDAIKHIVPSTPQNEAMCLPKGAFDAIRRIRVSRGTILKWMNSKSSLSHLDGFFLRLRIGKQEAELGRTGYYVARISVSTLINQN